MVNETKHDQAEPFNSDRPESGKTAQSNHRSREEWAAIIRETHGRSVRAIFEIGDWLKQAKEELDPQEYDRLVQSDLKFSSNRTAQRYTAIAGNSRLRARAEHLPPSWGTLYALHQLQLSAEQLDALIRRRYVNFDMTRAEAQRLRDEDYLAAVLRGERPDQTGTAEAGGNTGKPPPRVPPHALDDAIDALSELCRHPDDLRDLQDVACWSLGLEIRRLGSRAHLQRLDKAERELAEAAFSNGTAEEKKCAATVLGQLAQAKGKEAAAAARFLKRHDAATTDGAKTVAEPANDGSVSTDH